MNSDELWNTFLESGRITDYLHYREAIRQEMAAELPGAEDIHEFEHGRHRDSGKGDRRE